MAIKNTELINENRIDRSLRAFVGLACLQIAYFWLSGWWMTLFYLLSAVLFLTAAVGFCPLYRVLGLRSNNKQSTAGKVWLTIAALVFITQLVLGSYASHFFSKKFYLEDFNVMNNNYKQALFFTGQENRAKAIDNYDQLRINYARFKNKYLAYHPYALKGDGQFNDDLIRIEEILTETADNVRSGDLHQAHLMLEKVRPVFQNIFKRNNFSMLAVTLIDFHDTMELMLTAATLKDATQVKALYPQVDKKLQAIEVEANDADIQAIRDNLETLFKLAKSGAVEQLTAQGKKLKSSFVKVYLQRG
ncbi:hypothetical protein Ping_2751 [Psychromonas ingrahamii 37]|uniref:Inner membrane protein YgaP-like transmembrane domain-containing protein n=1 Tax=Psychromonas ingrahamii (strain DSM 17664 / CCUG 51855 / 37) TaxID=357804 RepID=A1SY93_PSYIN|nr:DUF2892 domain-containing protein [Psychromonas ingrahamii]ABM04458.1 hypothetical protein Ping_2751 [Psychromonas ingrahamii 37]